MSEATRFERESAVETKEVDAPEMSSDKFESMFGESMPTEEELMGLPSEEKDEAADESEGNTEPPSPTDDAKQEESETEAKAESDKQAEEPKEDDSKEESTEKPPKGYVPLQALHEERSRRQELAAKLGEVEQRLEKMAQAREEKPVEKAEISEAIKEEVADFASKYPDYADLIYEASREGERLRSRLEDHGHAIAFDLAEDISFRREMKQQSEERQKAEGKAAEDTLIDRSLTKMRAHMPNLYSDGDATARELAEFAVQNGLDGKSLGVLTDPTTRILVDGREQPLGEAAADLTIMLHNLKKAVGDADTEAIKKSLEADLRKEIEAEFAKKIKESPGHRDVFDTPKADQEDRGRDILGMSESQLKKLSEDEWRKVLGG